MMDQQRRRRWQLICGFVLIGMSILLLVLSFWAFISEGEKINKALIAVATSNMAIGVVILSMRNREQKGPTPPDPK